MVTAEELRDRIDKLTQEAEELLLQRTRDDAHIYQEQVKILQKPLDNLTGGDVLLLLGVPCCLCMSWHPSLGRVVCGSGIRVCAVLSSITCPRLKVSHQHAYS